MSKTSRYDLAKKARDKRLAYTTEMYAACECTYPLDTYRNRHGHGKTRDGKPCPAIAVWERHHEDEDEL